jgi:hypothetical protein
LLLTNWKLAYIQITAKPELPHQLEALGLDQSDYQHLLDA